MHQVDLTPRLQDLSKSILLAFGLIALALCFWSVLRADAILQRDDNPRLVEAELRIRRGSIQDRDDRLLAETTGTGSNLQRSYPLAGAGPAVGYYSFRHGTAGVEESYNAALSGATVPALEQSWQRLLHQPPQGQNLRLTLDGGWQQLADRLLLQQQSQGALVLLEFIGDDTAAVRIMVSHPGYDPNLLDEQFETLIVEESAPLLNRVTQSQYQPGRVLYPFLVAAAIDRGIIRLGETVSNGNRPVPVNGSVVRCAEVPPDPTSWRDALSNQCPGPIQDLANEMGVGGLEQAFAAFGLTTEPELPLVVAPADAEPIADLAAAAIGQENLTVTPLQVALALAALGDDGRLPTPRLVTEVQEENGDWIPVVIGGEDAALLETAVTPETAAPIRGAFVRHGSVADYGLLVLSGPEASTNAWYLGLAPAANPRFALVIVLENQDSVAGVTTVGRALLEMVGEQ